MPFTVYDMRQLIPILFLITWLCSGCVARPPIKVENPLTIKGPGWVAYLLSDNKWLVAYSWSGGEDAAMKEVCPIDHYLCVVEDAGELIYVERIEKK